MTIFLPHYFHHFFLSPYFLLAFWHFIYSEKGKMFVLWCHYYSFSWLNSLVTVSPLLSLYFIPVHFSHSLYHSFISSSPKPPQFPSCLCPLSLDFRAFPFWICPFLSYLYRNLLLFPLSPPGPFTLLVPLFLSLHRSSLVHGSVFNQSVSRPALQGEAELLIEKSRWKGGEVTEGGETEAAANIGTKRVCVC